MAVAQLRTDPLKKEFVKRENKKEKRLCYIELIVLTITMRRLFIQARAK